MSSLYAMQFNTGLVKVGRAKNPASRMEQHRARLAVADIHVAHQYTAPCIGDAGVAEDALIAQCASAGEASSAGSEWFTGLQFEDVRRWLDAVCAEPARPTTMDATKEALRRAADALGGQSALASACDFKDRRNVWPWFNTDRSVPAEHCPAIERATRAVAAERGDPMLIVTCEELRPDIPWGVLREQSQEVA